MHGEYRLLRQGGGRRAFAHVLVEIVESEVSNAHKHAIEVAALLRIDGYHTE